MVDKYAFDKLLKELEFIMNGEILKSRVKEYHNQSCDISTIWPIQKKILIVGFVDGSVLILRNDLQEVRKMTTNIGRIGRFIRISNEVYGFGNLANCIKFNQDFSQVSELGLPFSITLSDFSNASTTVVYFVSESKKIYFKKIKDFNIFENLEEIQLEFEVTHLRLLNSFLFVTDGLKIEKWNLNRVQKELSLSYGNITGIACSSNSCYFISDSTLYLINIQLDHSMVEEDSTQEVIAELKLDVKCISIAQKKFLYVLSEDLSIYDIRSSGFNHICTLSISSPATKIVADSNYLYLYSNTLITRIQTQENINLEKIIDLQNKNIIDYEYAYDNSFYICTSDNMILKYAVDPGKLLYFEQSNIVYHEDTIKCLAINLVKEEISVGCEESTIKVYNTKDLSLSKTLRYHKMPVIQLCYLNSNLVSLANYEDQVEIFFEDPPKLDEFRSTLKSSKNTLFCTYNMENIYILQANSIIVYNSTGKKEVKPIQEITHAQYFKCNLNYLVLIDTKIEVRELKTLEAICITSYEALSGENIQAVGICSRYLLLASSGNLHVLSIENKLFIGSINLNLRIFDISFYEDFIYLNAEKGVMRIRNFLVNPEKIVIGSQMPSLAFLCYLDPGLKKREIPEHIHSWTILPQCINILHLFSFTSSRDLLKKSFKKQANFIKSVDNISPLTISLRKGFKEISEYLVKKIARESKLQPFILSIIEQDLPEINSSNLSSISCLYNEAMVVSSQPGLPTNIVPYDQEKVVLSFGFVINPENFVDKSKSEEDDKFVTFFTSKLRLHFATGSMGCVKFLESLLYCEDAQVFSSQIIKDYLNHKWQSAGTYLKFNSVIYLMFLILLTVEDKIQSFSWRVLVLGIICLLNSLSLFLEYFQLRYSFKAYLKSKTNWIDLIRVVVTYIYMIVVFTDQNEIADNKVNRDQISLSTILLFISYLRGMIYFKMIKETRYMIKMIEEIIKDAFFFALILVYILLALTTFYHFARTDRNSSYTESFALVYLIMFGEFGFNKTAVTEWLTFIVISILLPLIMFNLLVAIMAGTYERVYNTIIENDFKAMTQLILEAEVVKSAFMNPENSQMYLHKCIVGSYKEEDHTGTINAKIKSCITEINSLIGKCRNIEKNDLIENFRKYQNEKMEKLGELKIFIERRKKEVSDLFEIS